MHSTRLPGAWESCFPEGRPERSARRWRFIRSAEEEAEQLSTVAVLVFQRRNRRDRQSSTSTIRCGLRFPTCRTIDSPSRVGCDPPTATPRSVPQCQCPFKRSVCQCPAATSTRRSPTSRHPPSVCRRVAQSLRVGSGGSDSPALGRPKKSNHARGRQRKEARAPPRNSEHQVLPLNQFFYIFFFKNGHVCFCVFSFAQ